MVTSVPPRPCLLPASIAASWSQPWLWTGGSGLWDQIHNWGQRSPAVAVLQEQGNPPKAAISTGKAPWEGRTWAWGGELEASKCRHLGHPSCGQRLPGPGPCSSSQPFPWQGQPWPPPALSLRQAERGTSPSLAAGALGPVPRLRAWARLGAHVAAAESALAPGTRGGMDGNRTPRARGSRSPWRRVTRRVSCYRAASTEPEI